MSKKLDWDQVRRDQKAKQFKSELQAVKKGSKHDSLLRLIKSIENTKADNWDERKIGFRKSVILTLHNSYQQLSERDRNFSSSKIGISARKILEAERAKLGSDFQTD